MGWLGWLGMISIDVPSFIKLDAPPSRYPILDWLAVPHYTDHTAEIGTADATWALFWVTCLAALATFLAVIAAFVVPVLDQRARQRELRKEQGQRRKAIARELLLVWDLIADIESGLAKGPPSETELWGFLNKISVLRRMSEVHLMADYGDLAYPRYLLQTTQALYEVRDACQGLLPGNNWANHPKGLDIARDIVRLAQERTEDVTAALKAVHMQ